MGRGDPAGTRNKVYEKSYALGNKSVRESSQTIARHIKKGEESSERSGVVLFIDLVFRCLEQLFGDTIEQCIDAVISQ